MLTNPQKAIESYKLTEDEKNVLSRPKTSIYELLQPHISPTEDLLNIGTPPPCTTTTTTAYCVTTTSYSRPKDNSNGLKALKNEIDSEVVKQTVNSIRQSSGAERFEQILELVSQCE
ncbi:MAG: hypothetical protein AAF349_21795 [Cyanobacteria bacterium P01_A01_bin.68]